MVAWVRWHASQAPSISACRHDQRAEGAALNANTADRTMAMTVQTVGPVHSLVELTAEGTKDARNFPRSQWLMASDFPHMRTTKQP